MTTDPAGISARDPARSASPRNGFWERLQAFFASRVMKPGFWIVLVLMVIAVPVGRAVTRERPKPPAMKLQLPDFQLTSERGEKFGSAELRGKVYVADFVFTSCPTVCPKLTAQMVKIQHRSRHMGTAFQLVTFTVDPENDTPDKLAEYAHRYHANPGRWTFLTGPLGDVETTVVRGFKMAMGKEEAAEGIFSIFHGERLVLVDQNGMIRGYYEADDAGIDAMLRDAGVLANLGA